MLSSHWLAQSRPWQIDSHRKSACYPQQLCHIDASQLSNRLTTTLHWHFSQQSCSKSVALFTPAAMLFSLFSVKTSLLFPAGLSSHSLPPSFCNVTHCIRQHALPQKIPSTLRVTICLRQEALMPRVLSPHEPHHKSLHQQGISMKPHAWFAGIVTSRCPPMI